MFGHTHLAVSQGLLGGRTREDRLKTPGEKPKRAFPGAQLYRELRDDEARVEEFD